MNPQDEIIDLEEKIQHYTVYCQMKLKEKDYHGVADAAMDIREFVAKIEVWSEIKRKLGD